MSADAVAFLMACAAITAYLLIVPRNDPKHRFVGDMIERLGSTVDLIGNTQAADQSTTS